MELFLSIIVPVFNTDMYLEKCINSILCQRYRNYELILVDDGSFDNSPAICDKYAQMDTRVQVIHKQNLGVMSARKAGILCSRGEYISFVDSDDWIEEDFYDILINDLQKNQVDVLMTGYKEEGVHLRNIRTGLVNGVFYKNEIKNILENSIIIPSLCLKLFKRDLIKKNISLIDNRVYIGEDLLCTYACLLDADTMMVHNLCRYHYVQHESSAMHVYSEKKINNLLYFSQNIKYIRQVKSAYFLDLMWNGFVINELLCVVEHEFGSPQLLSEGVELRELKRKFASLKLSNILISSNCGVKNNLKKRREKVIFALYFLGFFRLLNLYVMMTRKRT